MQDIQNLSFKLAILFPHDEVSPKLIWVDCERIDDEDGSTYEYPRISNILGSDDPYPGHKRITWSVLRNFGLGHTIEVICRDAFLGDGSKTNQSIVHVTRGAMVHDWRGPIVVLHQPGTYLDLPCYEDVTIADFRHAVDYFSSHGSRPVPDLQDLTIRDYSKIVGIKVTCLGDQEVLGLEPYVAVGVPRDHPVFLSSNPTAISKLIEFPVLVWKYLPDRAWKDNRDIDPYQNRAATFLRFDADPESKTWGWAPFPEWQNEVGGVLVVRQDKKDLTSYQVEALCHFCLFRMQPLFEDSLGGGSVERTREEVMGFMNRNSFTSFFEEYRKERAEQDSAWATAKSPYANE